METHECSVCGETLEVRHKPTHDGVNCTIDIAYCDRCDIKYEANHDILRTELSGHEATSALRARMEAVNKPAIDILASAFDTDAAWARPIQECRFSNRVENAATASRTTAVEVPSKGFGEYALLRFYGTCDVCSKTHVTRKRDVSLTHVGTVDFTMADGPVKLRCYCGEILEDVTGDIEKTWECTNCDRRFSRGLTGGSTPP